MLDDLPATIKNTRSRARKKSQSPPRDAQLSLECSDPLGQLRPTPMWTCFSGEGELIRKHDKMCARNECQLMDDAEMRQAPTQLLFGNTMWMIGGALPP